MRACHDSPHTRPAHGRVVSGNPGRVFGIVDEHGIERRGKAHCASGGGFRVGRTRLARIIANRGLVRPRLARRAHTRLQIRPSPARRVWAVGVAAVVAERRVGVVVAVRAAAAAVGAVERE